MRDVEVVVVGAGQAGLSAAYHLQRRGLAPGTGFAVLDANAGPGGAWQHRWPSLTLDRTHQVHDLPGLPLGRRDPHEPASAVVSRYYDAYEQHFGLAVHRPVRVRTVSSEVADGAARTDAHGAPHRRLMVHTDHGTWRARALVNATGTWDKPHWPYYPGRARNRSSSPLRGRHARTKEAHSARS